MYLDFSKAFDKVETGVLLHKLRDAKVLGKVGVWLSAFLDPKSRMQAVRVDGRISPLVHVLSGVPQGTVLGPILFLVHIRGISHSLSQGTSASSFADDTRVVRVHLKIVSSSRLISNPSTIGPMRLIWSSTVSLNG